MKKEIEAKAIKIDKDDIRKKLKDNGCKLVFKEKKFVRKVYELPSSSPFIDRSGIWIRLRTDGEKTDLTLKIFSEKMKWAKEMESEVKDFKIISEILELTGFKQKGHQENLREKWVSDKVEFCIDTWPMVDPWLEIEGPNEKTIKEWFKKLGLDYKKAYYGSSDIVYRDVYNLDIHLLNTLLLENE
jgi:adenylate cyclase, class 2